MKQTLIILLISSQFIFAQNFLFKSDTIKTNYQGVFKNAIKFNDNFYFFTETENNGYSNVQTYHFYKMDLNGKATKIKVPNELQVYYVDLYSKNDSLFVVEYYDKNTYYLDTNQNKWVKTKQSEDIIYEDEEYRINSIDFGEYGGYTWFINKHTKKQNVLALYFDIGEKFNENFILTNSNLIIKVENPEKLKFAKVPYEKINFGDEESYILFNKILHYGLNNNNNNNNNNNFQTIFKEDYYNAKINIFTSFLLKNNLYFIYFKDKQASIGQLKDGKFNDIYRFNSKLNLFRYHYDYRNSINKEIQFETTNEYINGIVEINNNLITTYYIQNLNITPILSPKKALDWFKKHFKYYSNNLKQLNYNDVSVFEKEINSFPILLGKGLNTYRTKEENNLILTKEYYFSIDTDKIRHITFFWDYRNHFESDKDKIGKITNKKFSEILEFLTQTYGEPNSIEIYKNNKSSYEWETKDIKIDLFKSHKRVAIDIKNR